jgi:hypothetical protein
MKAERRHELQENSLSRFIDNLPVMARLYADRILLVIVLILLVVVLIRWRMNGNATRAAGVANDVATARSSVQQLSNLRMVGPPDQIAGQRSRAIDEVNAAIDDVSANVSNADAALQAQALIVKGDLYWTLANLPDIPGAATQPTLRLPRSRDEYLTQAADAYHQVLTSFPNEPAAAMSANFALAAIAENRHQWDEATKIYDQIKNSGAEQMYKDLADARLKLLPDIEAPILIGSLTTRPAEPTMSMPTPMMVPATQPGTAPTTQAMK